MFENKFFWYVLTTKPKNEQRASNNLQDQGYEVFLPTVELTKTKSGRRVIKVETLFPSYLFIKANQVDANFNSIRSTPGVANFVRFGAKLAVIDELLILKLKKDLINHDIALNKTVIMQPDEKVTITEGPFSGLEAIYQHQDGLLRSVLLLKMLHNTLSVNVANEHVQKSGK